MDSLINQFLIAMPNLDDPYFNRSVIYLVKHDHDGAMGFIINQPISQLTVEQLLEKMELPTSDNTSSHLQQQVFNGGPVNQERGFVLHTPQQGWSSSEQCSETIMMTTSKDIMSTLGTNEAPQDFIIALGFASWQPGQLEQEILDNSWLTTHCDPSHLFTTPIEERWQLATQQLGFDVWQLASQAGHS